MALLRLDITPCARFMRGLYDNTESITIISAAIEFARDVEVRPLLMH